MKTITFGRRGTVVASVTVAALALAGGIAYATIPGPDSVYNACMLKSIGTIRLIDKSLPASNFMSRCTDKEIEISWNQAGQPGPVGPQGAKGDSGAPGKDGANGTNGTDGEDGVSVTTASESAGTNCAGGGVQLTAANGVGYVCNGKAGADGKDGANGANGADGQDGVSVTSAVEPAGGNCTNGGSKFTATNGVTYACNGDSATVAPEPWRNVGEPGQPGFQNGWVSGGIGFTHQAVASFFKDLFGVVHLKGTVHGGPANSTVFTLPAGYRPALEEYFSVYSCCTSSPLLVVSANGSVSTNAGSQVTLSGVTFRAG